ncbi:hypothetical protein HAX54_025389 [Datura stramonium]|uniref:Uncharacterized protein n=1 Tax=Datura stramonium TaxID=4076 RepID=A0ABS8V1D2_DATST|nr:hypothetical protein [Datura stramonium]
MVQQPAQEIGLAPAPAPDAGAGFSLAQSETTSAQEIGLAPAPDAGWLLSGSIWPDISNRQFSINKPHQLSPSSLALFSSINSSKWSKLAASCVAFMLAVVLAAVAASAQEIGLAPAPSLRMPDLDSPCRFLVL